MSQSTSTSQTEVINFREIPSPLLVPGSYQEIVPGYQKFGLFAIPSRTLFIGGKTSALLVAGVDDAQLAVGKQVVEAQDIIARDAEHVAYTIGVKALDEVFADGR